MSKTKKYSLAYWVKKCMNAWTPEKDILAAVQEFIRLGEHTQIEFSGTPLEFATALYLERFKRGTPWTGFYPTPAKLAAWAADLLPLQRGAVVLDPGCGFGALSQAIQQRGAEPILVECSSAVVPIAQAIWGKDRVHYHDFLDGFRPTEFDAVITNSPFGNVFGHSDAAGDFLERIADLSRGGMYVAAILPRGYLAAERPKRRVEIAQRFTIIEKRDLDNGLFAPLTNIATTLYLLNVRRDGRLVGEVRPRLLPAPDNKTTIDNGSTPPAAAQPIEMSGPPNATEPEPEFTPYEVVQEHDDDFVLIRGRHPVTGWVTSKAFAPENRGKAIDWLKQRGVDLRQVAGVSPAERGESFCVPTFGLANTHPLQMTTEIFAAWAGAIERTSPEAAAAWRQVRLLQENSKVAHWPLLADGYLPRAWLPDTLDAYLHSTMQCVFQHSVSTAYEAWGNDHLIIMQPKGTPSAKPMPWTVCYAAQLPSANSAGEYVPLPLTPIGNNDESRQVQGATLFEALNTLRDHVRAWQVAVNPTLKLNGLGWTETSLRELREIVVKGTLVLVADDQLGLPTIHQIPHPEHMGFGTFRSVTETYTVNWDAGGSLNRLSNGQGWTQVIIEKGVFSYDTAKMVQLLDGWIAELSQTPRLVITTLHVDTAKIEREFTEAAQSARGKELWQMTRAEFQATQRPISDGAAHRTLLDIILAHGRDIQAGSDNVQISERIKRTAIVWLDDLRHTLVQIALTELKPVPDGVLTDFPDLAAKYPRAAADDRLQPVVATAPKIDTSRAKKPKSKKTHSAAETPVVNIPIQWQAAARFEFDLDSAPVIVEYDGADSIGFKQGNVHFGFHGPTISSTGFHSFFGRYVEWSQFDNPEMYAISVAQRLAAEKAKELVKNRKKWPFVPPADLQVTIADRTHAARPIFWNDFNQWWSVWLIDQRMACSVKCEQIVGYDPSWRQALASKKTKKKPSTAAAQPAPASDMAQPPSSDLAPIDRPGPVVVNAPRPTDSPRPKNLPSDLPEIIEVDVGGRVPQWLTATIVRATGTGPALRLIARRSDGRGEVKLPIYGRDINWRVPATVV